MPGVNLSRHRSVTRPALGVACAFIAAHPASHTVVESIQPNASRNSVVVCDNATLHHDQLGWLEQLVHSRGAIIVYLPPYACDLNPIESKLRVATSAMRPSTNAIRMRCQRVSGISRNRYKIMQRKHRTHHGKSSATRSIALDLRSRRSMVRTCCVGLVSASR